jgi:hypothetical protein
MKETIDLFFYTYEENQITMLTINNILKEIKDVPVDRLEVLSEKS